MLLRMYSTREMEAVIISSHVSCAGPRLLRLALIPTRRYILSLIILRRQV